MQGVKLILKSKEGQVLGVRSKDSFDLPSWRIEHVDEIRHATRELFKAVTGDFPEKDPIPAYRGYDDEFGKSSSYIQDWEGTPKLKTAEWGKPVDILCGQWGLFARDAFHRVKIINRPKLNVDELYKISKHALDEGSRFATEGVDKVLDEIVFLMDINKSEAVDELLQHVELHRLHADIIFMFMSAIEDYELPSKADFLARAEAAVQEVDKLRTKMKLRDECGNIISHDVRGDALKYYRKKAQEFGKQLRAGTLGTGTHRGGAPLPRKKAN